MIDAYALELENQRLKDEVDRLRNKLSENNKYVHQLQAEVRKLHTEIMDDDCLQVSYSEYVNADFDGLIWDPNTKSYKRYSDSGESDS